MYTALNNPLLSPFPQPPTPTDATKIETNILIGFIIMLLVLMFMGFMFVNLSQDFKQDASQQLEEEGAPVPKDIYV